MLRRSLSLLVRAVAMLAALSFNAYAQRQAKREAKIAESAEPKSVKGAATF